MVGIFEKLMLAREIQFKDGQLVLLGQRMLIMPAQYFAFNLKYAKNQEFIGKLQYYAAKKAQIGGFPEAIAKKYKMNLRDLIQWIVNTTELAGWGKFTIKNFEENKKRMRILVADSPIANYLTPSLVPIDHAIRGFIAGTLQSTFKTECDCLEKECSSSNSKFCDFIVQPTKDIDFSSDIAKTQLFSKPEIQKYFNKY